jgi:DNA-binding IclR family transcriptional regulator
MSVLAERGGPTMAAQGEARYKAPAAGCAADVLVALARSRNPLTASQLAEHTGATRSLVYRVLIELGRRGLVQEQQIRGSNSAAYSLGVGVIELGGSYAQSVPFMQSVQRTLRRLADVTDETASLATLQGDKVLYLAREEGERSVFSVSQVGKQLPANATAVGKALLAQFSDGQVRELYARPSSELRALTTASLTEMDALLADLRQARLRGYAIEDGETVAGRCCVAVAFPVDGPDADSVAISVSTDHARFQQVHQEFAALLLDAKRLHAAEVDSRHQLGDSSRADIAVGRAVGSRYA